MIDRDGNHIQTGTVLESTQNDMRVEVVSVKNHTAELRWLNGTVKGGRAARLSQSELWTSAWRVSRIQHTPKRSIAVGLDLEKFKSPMD
jgi:hypothetical protein